MKRVFFIIFALLPVLGFGQNQLRIGGYVKYLPSQTWVNKNVLPVYFQAYFPESSNDHLIHNRVNVSYGTAYEAGPPWWSIEMGVRNRLFYGFQASTIGFRETLTEDPGLLSLKWVWNERGEIVGLTEMDRFFFHYETNKFILNVGRQRINWGIHNVFNPNDIFNQYNYFDFDYEERPGSDAVLFQYNLGDGFSSLSLAYSPSKYGWDQSTLAALYKGNWKGYDYQILAGYSNFDYVLGGGWAGAIGGVGFKGEIAQYLSADAKRSDNNLTGTMGADYMFSNGIYTSISYLYNGLGSVHPTLEQQLLLRQARLSSKNIFPYRHSLMLTGSYNITELFGVNLSLLQSHNFDQAALIPGFSYSLTQNIDAMLMAQIFSVRNSVNDPALFTTAVYARLKWSF